MNPDPVIVSVIISGVISLLGIGAGFLVTRRLNQSQVQNNESSAVSQVSESSVKLLGPLNDRIDKLIDQMTKVTDDLCGANERIQKLTEALKQRDAELEGLRGGVVVLVAQLKEAGISPRYIPPDYEARGKL